MEAITIAIIAWSVIGAVAIYIGVSSLLFNRRMAKYYEFQAELEAKENEWERIRLR